MERQSNYCSENALQASPVMLELYARLMKYFEKSNEYIGYQSLKKVPALTSAELAGTLYHYFPSHFYKALHAICLYENKHQQLTTSLLHQRRITVLDIGAGIGTFSLALMDFIYKWGGNTQPDLDVILIDPDQLSLRIACKLCKNYAKRTNIGLKTLETIPYRFPEDRCLSEVCVVLQKIPVEFLAIGMCNILNWLGKGEIRSLRSSSYEREFKFIRTVIDLISPLYAVLFSVETKEALLGARLGAFYKLLSRKADIYRVENPTKVTVMCRNFPHSAYMDITDFENKYWSATAEFKTTMAQMTNLETLKSCYFKARMALRREFPCDEVEIRLFELDLDRNLSICARQIHQGYTFWRNAIEFKAPKDSQNMRPKVVDSVSDALVGTAFLHVIGRPIDSQFLRVSCGNRLEERVDSEYIYRWFWPAWYHEYYISSIEEAAKRGLKYYCQMDIESFYPSISQAKLMKKLDIVLPRQNNRIQQLIQSLIIHQWRGAKRGYGLPQGPLPSGFLANLYMDGFDHFALKIVQPFQGIYRRYVDDMLLFAKDLPQLAEVQRKINDYLKQDLELHINNEKTRTGKTTELEQKIVHPDLDNFDRRLKRLIRSFYNLDNSYGKLLKSKTEEFIRTYCRLLRELGIYISEQWLLRRLVFKGYIHQYITSYLRKDIIRIKYPRFPNRSLDFKAWAKEFAVLNPAVMEEIASLQQHLAQEMQRLHTQYGSMEEGSLDKETYKQIRARYRFYSYRAGILRVPQIIPILRELLPKPWLYSIIGLRSYPELIQDIVNTLKTTKLRYIQYTMIWALGELKAATAVPVLQELLFSNGPMLLKLAASQALLKIDHVGDRFDCRRLWMEIEKNKRNPKLLKNLLLLLRYCPVSEGQREELEREINTLDGVEGNLCRLALKWALEENRNLLDLFDVLPETVIAEEYPELEPDIQVYGIS